MTLVPAYTPLITTCCIACLVMLCAVGCERRSESMQSALKMPFSIFATCDTQGWIEPCGCASGQSGGLSRRATLIDQLAKDDERLLVSVGGAAFGDQPYDIEKFNAIVDGEVLMGYEIHNLGVSEVQLPLPESRQLTFLSTNLEGVQGIKKSVSIDRGGWKILVLGVVSQSALANAAGVRVAPPERSILNEIESQTESFDCVVVLAYMNQNELADLAANVPEVDVIIGGKTQQSISPIRSGQTLLTAVANKGKFVARVRASVNDGDRTPTWNADLHEVSSELAEDQEQQSNLAAFRKRLSDLDFSASQTSFDVFPADEGNHYAGSDACQTCHQQDTETWERSSHAHAWRTLVDVGAHVDSSCQRCHTVGFGGTGGFVNRKSSMDRIDVGCESCHGPSSRHVADESVPTPWLAVDSCLSCHDHENSPHFQYDHYWQQIEHGNGVE
ncbi:multiheme c-type cytochrome [Stieleria varia]|uniref:Perchlorate reductase subunit gamma n=1 Tax=Stieleria varia TaxID=2528005 RepID=A0A5C6A5S3_9BACT|nr:multiheme c-type cytochrome [Stieleria varia]TWT94411.1 Perchlorate reductase subunit gamma precursor [Stieleria varia]